MNREELVFSVRVLAHSPDVAVLARLVRTMHPSDLAEALGVLSTEEHGKDD